MTSPDKRASLLETHPAQAMLGYLAGRHVGRVLIIAAHPDDEIVGAGVAMASLPNLRVVHVTDGVPSDPRYSTSAGFKTPEGYRKARADEAHQALNLVGLPSSCVIRLGFVDQQLSRSLVSLTKALAQVIHEYSPDLVITHPYEGGHPDHDAACFATHHALYLLEQSVDDVPTIVEMTSYFCRYGERVVSEFAQGNEGAVGFLLEDAERVLKAKLYGCFKSQSGLLDTFPVEVERFRLAPRYEFAHLPPVAEILYDDYDLGIRSTEWLKLSRAAIKALKPEAVLDHYVRTGRAAVRFGYLRDMGTIKLRISAWMKVKRTVIKKFKDFFLRQHCLRTDRPEVGTVDFGDLARVEPISRCFGYDRGIPIDRPYIESFLREHRQDIRGRVLEIGDNSYTLQFGAGRVSHSDVLHVKEGAPGATIIGDLSDAPEIPDNTFDCLILTQVLVVIFDLPATVATIHRILKPGGVALITVPGISNVDQGEWKENWMWSFTPNSLRQLLHLHFPQEGVQVSSRGNLFTSIAFLQGLSTEDLEGYPPTKDDPHYPLTVLGRAVKQQHSN